MMDPLLLDTWRDLAAAAAFALALLLLLRHVFESRVTGRLRRMADLAVVPLVGTLASYFLGRHFG